MKFWITRTSKESFMLTSLPPTIASVVGTTRSKAYVSIGDPVGVRNLCLMGVRSIAPDIKLDVLESVQVDINVSVVGKCKENDVAEKTIEEFFRENGYSAVADDLPEDLRELPVESMATALRSMVGGFRTLIENLWPAAEKFANLTENKRYRHVILSYVEAAKKLSQTDECGES